MCTATRLRTFFTCIFLLGGVVPASASAQRPANSGADTTTAPPGDELPDPRLVRRWAGMMATVVADFRREQRDPVGQIEADFSTRVIRIALRGTGGEILVSRTLTDAELSEADLDLIAHQLYDASMWRVPNFSHRR